MVRLVVTVPEGDTPPDGGANGFLAVAADCAVEAVRVTVAAPRLDPDARGRAPSTVPGTNPGHARAAPPPAPPASLNGRPASTSSPTSSQSLRSTLLGEAKGGPARVIGGRGPGAVHRGPVSPWAASGARRRP